jgi:hypothetical protein
MVSSVYPTLLGHVASRYDNRGLVSSVGVAVEVNWVTRYRVFKGTRAMRATDMGALVRA